MKSKFMSLIYHSLGLLALVPVPAAAYTLSFDPAVGETTNPLQTYTKLGTKDPAYIVFTIINTSLIFLGTITVILVIVAGFMWLFAAGQEEKITKAKDILKGSVIGLVIVMASYGLAQYVFTALRFATTGQ